MHLPKLLAFRLFILAIFAMSAMAMERGASSEKGTAHLDWQKDRPAVQEIEECQKHEQAVAAFLHKYNIEELCKGPEIENEHLPWSQEVWGLQEDWSKKVRSLSTAHATFEKGLEVLRESVVASPYPPMDPNERPSYDHRRLMSRMAREQNQKELEDLEKIAEKLVAARNRLLAFMKGKETQDLGEGEDSVVAEHFGHSKHGYEGKGKVSEHDLTEQLPTESKKGKGKTSDSDGTRREGLWPKWNRKKKAD